MMFPTDESDELTAVAHLMNVGLGPGAAGIIEPAQRCNVAIHALGGHLASVDRSNESLGLTASGETANCHAAAYSADVCWVGKPTRPCVAIASKRYTMPCVGNCPFPAQLSGWPC